MIDAQRLDCAAPEGIGGDVECEQFAAGNGEGPVDPQQKHGDDDVPNGFVEERGVIQTDCWGGDRTVGRVDLQCPGQRGRPATDSQAQP